MATTTEESPIKVTARNLSKLIKLIDSTYAHKATTLAGYGITDAATSAQGTKADSAIQKIIVNGVEQAKTDGIVDLSELSSAGNADAVQKNLDTHIANTSNPHKITKATIGLGSVENKSSATIRGELTSANVTKALGFTPVDASLKGAASGLAELDSSGKVPAAQLPSYVDDVLEYTNTTLFPEEGESGKIYVATATNKSYRWTGSGYTELSQSVALGETSSTAYRGDRGAVAYKHSQTAHAPANAEANVQSDWNETDSASDAFILNKPTSLPANGGNADTVSGHTVKSDVPENADFTNTTYNVMGGASSSKAGSEGLVPAPAAGAQAKFLRGDGTWQAANNYTHPTTSGNKHIPSGGSTGQILKWASDGTATWGSDIIGTTITVPTSAWAADSTYTSYPYRATISNSQITAADNVSITLSVASLVTAEAAYVAPGGETYAGGLYLYAKNVPTNALTGAMIIFKG